MSAVSELVSHVKLGVPRRFGRLSLTPAHLEGDAQTDFLLLDEALAAGRVEISESSEAGSVPVLKLKSSAGVPILLLDGEELVGAKQNRILNTTVLAEAGADMVLPVSCVEQGRWRYVSRTFGKSDQALFARARARKSMRMMNRRKAAPPPPLVEGALARSLFDDHDAGQGEVWDDIANKLASMKVASASSAMFDGYARNEDRLYAFEEALQPGAGERGAVFAMDGRVVGLEILPSEAAYRTFFRKLIRSYALDAIEDADQPVAADPPGGAAEDFLRRVAAADLHSAPAVGLGEDIRLEGAQCTGHALIHAGVVLHVAAFDQALAA